MRRFEDLKMRRFENRAVYDQRVGISRSTNCHFCVLAKKMYRILFLDLYKYLYSWRLLRNVFLIELSAFRPYKGRSFINMLPWPDVCHVHHYIPHIIPIGYREGAIHISSA